MADYSTEMLALFASMDTYSAKKLNKHADTVSGLKYNVKLLTVTTGAVTIDLKEAQVYTIAPTGNVTFSFINPPEANGFIASVIRINKGGLYTITWPVNTYFEDGIAPVLSNTLEDILTIQYDTNADKYWVTNVKSNWSTAA